MAQRASVWGSRSSAVALLAFANCHAITKREIFITQAKTQTSGNRP